MSDDKKTIKDGKLLPKTPSKKHSENTGHRSDNLRANLLRRKQQKKDRQDEDGQ